MHVGMIHRGERPSDRFAQISNAALEDARLSFRARGLLAYLLSRPMGWSMDSTALSRQGVEGRDAIRTALDELIEHGYLAREKVHDERGRWTTNLYVTDTPDGKPGPGFPALDNQALSTKKESSKKETTPPYPPRPSSPAVGPGFEEFYAAYPRRIERKAAERAWESEVVRAGIDPALVIASAKAYAAEKAGENPRYIKHPASWLRANDLTEPYVPASAPARPSGRQAGNDVMAQMLAMREQASADPSWLQIGGRT